MKNHGILHRIAIAVGLFLGITATGVGAKANANQPANTANNNDQQTNHLDQSSIQNKKTTLIRQQNSVNNNDNDLKQGTQAQADNNQINNDQEQSRQSVQKINHQTSQLYNRIVSFGINKSTHKFDYSSNHNASKVYRVKSKQYSISAEGAHQVNGRYHRNKRSSGIIYYYHHHRNQVNGVDHSYHNRYVHKGSFQSIKPHRIYRHHNWFRDGLNHRNLRARNWVSMHESGHHWYILSYGHVCVGYFQLNPHYLGYRHGHVDLRPRHQVKVADRYVRGRYGNWVNAKHFWEYHHWY